MWRGKLKCSVADAGRGTGVDDHQGDALSK